MSHSIPYVRTFVHWPRRTRAVTSSRRGRVRLGPLAAAVLACLMTLAAAPRASAVPGELPSGSQRVFDFTVVGCPGGPPRGFPGDGREIFVTRDASGARLRIENADSNWSVADENGTSNHPARLAASKPGIYDVYVRVLETPKTGDRKLSHAVIDWNTGEILSLVGTVDLTDRRQSTLELTPAAMFEASLQELTWSMDLNPELRIAQLRVYARTGAASL